MQCLRQGCNNKSKGHGKYCSESCRAIYNRNKRNEGGTVEIKKPEHLPDQTVYGRPAISCSEFSSRPEPEQPDDKPVSGNRGRYRRLDGTEYQIDSVGKICDIRSGTEVVGVPASLKDYNEPDGRAYAQRENPAKLNWGKPLTFHELQASPFTANRVSIPGDWDFKEAVSA